MSATKDHRPPRSVIAATACLGVSYAAGFVTWIFTAHWHEPIVPVIYATFCILFFLLLRAIYLGRRWARLLIIVFALLAVVYVQDTFASFTLTIERVRFVAQMLLQVAAVVLLLLPSARRWYSRDIRLYFGPNGR